MGTDRRYGVVQGMAVKVPCQAATTANITLSGLQTIDGVSLATGDRCLVWQQTNSVSNGVYVVDTGSWTRDVDFDGQLDVVQGTLVIVNGGSLYGNAVFKLTSANPITIGSSAITFSQQTPPALASLAASSGSSLVGFIQAGTGAVARTVQAKERDIVSVKDFGAVADGNFVAGGSPSGTDNLAAFNAALAAATSLGISAVKVPGGFYYLSAGITLPRGVTIYGDGTSHLPIVTQTANRTGSCLLINGAVSGDCVAFAENTGHSGLRDISVYNTNTNAIRSVVSVVGHLYPRLKNVEIASLRKTTGVGLYLAPSSAGVAYETLWGDFDNVIAAISDVGTANEASVRWGLSIYGNSATKVCNANSFRAGQFAGCWGGLIIDGAVTLSGALSCVFHGTKFDTNWDGTYTPQFQSAASGVFGYLKTSCYIYPVAKVVKGFNTTFHGCYFEAAGAPANYNDGINGSFPLLGVVWNDSATECIGTGIHDCSWNGVYLYDKGAKTNCSPDTAGRRHDTRLVPFLHLQLTAQQTFTQYSTTTVATTAVVSGDDGSLEWDAGASLVRIRSSGVYQIHGQVTFVANAAAAGTYMATFITKNGTKAAGTGTSYYGEELTPQGAGVANCIQQTVTLSLSLGDTISFEALQTVAATLNSVATLQRTYLQVMKIS